MTINKYLQEVFSSSAEGKCMVPCYDYERDMVVMHSLMMKLLSLLRVNMGIHICKLLVHICCIKAM